MYYTLEWQKAGAPKGFFVFRYDHQPEEGWYLINKTNGAIVCTIAVFLQTWNLGLNKYEMDQRFPTAYMAAGAPSSYSLADYAGPAALALHYQVVQWWLINGSAYLSTYTTTAPTFTNPEDANGNSAADQYAFVRTPYFVDTYTKKLALHATTFTDKNPPPVGTVPYVEADDVWVLDYPFKSYAGLDSIVGYDKGLTLELKGRRTLQFESDLLINDIPQNVVVYE